MSINLLFEMSRRSFRSLNAAMNTVGQNIANVETEGYTRRRVVLTPYSVNNPGIQTKPPLGSVMGAGVSVQTYERMRDGLLLRSAWDMNAGLGFSDEEKRVLGAIEGLFPVDSEGALGAQLGQFWNGWSDLANEPADNSVRKQLRSRASALATTLNRLDNDLQNLETETQTALADGVKKVNDLLRQIADLNDDIAYAVHQGSANSDAEEQRDLLIGKLSEYANVRVTEADNGAVTVTLDGMAVVQNTHVLPLELDVSTDPPALRFEGTNLDYRVANDSTGRLGAWVRLLGETLPSARGALDDLAGTLVRRVNALHTTGLNLNGTTNNFFYYDVVGGVEQGVTAATIRLSDEVLADSTNIVASAGDPTNGFQDSTIASAIAALRDDATLMDGGTATTETFVINMIGGFGAQLERANAQYANRSAASMHLEAMERGVSGVSLEEEMTNLMSLQNAFQASARMLNTVQEMLDNLFAI